MNELERYQRVITEVSAENSQNKIKLIRLRSALEVYQGCVDDALEVLKSVRESISDELERCK